MKRPRPYENPSHLTPMRQTLSAIGMGISIAGVGVALADLYRKPSLALGALVLGVGMTALHLPWDDLVHEAEDAL